MALGMHRKSNILSNGKNHHKDEKEVKILKSIITSEYPSNPLEILGEGSFNPPRVVPKEEIGTPVQEFFRDATVFITGSTGFMGKILTEKLLRDCPHLKHIYLLVRYKKGKTSDERIKDIFKNRLYKRLQHEFPDFYKKVTVMNGNVEEPELGLSDEDKKKFTQEVNVVFHGAATVRFDEKIKLAVKINVNGTREILKLAKRAENLKVMMHVSTAYSFCPHSEIEEKFYDMPDHYIDIINKVETMHEAEVDLETPKILSEWPNTYTFTKALAECAVKNESQGLPIGLFRPSVVVSTYQEPVCGWTDNLYGPIALLLSIVTGVLHVYDGSYEKKSTDMVPVDFVVNGLICAAKETEEKYENAKLAKKEIDIPVYIYSSGTQNPITWGKFIDYLGKYSLEWPSMKAVWYYSITFIENRYLYTILSHLFHTIPGYVFDFLAWFVGEKPGLTKIYSKMNNVRDLLAYFRKRDWVFKNTNTQALWKNLTEKDKQIFFFNIADLSWNCFIQAMCLGLRVYLLKDDIHTLPAARSRYRRLYYAHIAVETLFFGLLLYLFWSLMVFILL